VISTDKVRLGDKPDSPFSTALPSARSDYFPFVDEHVRLLDLEDYRKRPRSHKIHAGSVLLLGFVTPYLTIRTLRVSRSHLEVFRRTNIPSSRRSAFSSSSLLPPPTPPTYHQQYLHHQHPQHIHYQHLIINITNIEGDNEDFLHESKASKLRTCGKSPHHKR